MESGERGRQLFAIPAGIALSEVSTCGRGESFSSVLKQYERQHQRGCHPASTRASCTCKTHPLLHVGSLVSQLALALFSQQPFTHAKASRAPAFPLFGCFCVDVCKEAASKRRLFLSFALAVLIPCVCVRLSWLGLVVSELADEPKTQTTLVPASRPVGRLLFQFDFGEEHPKKQPFRPRGVRSIYL